MAQLDADVERYAKTPGQKIAFWRGQAQYWMEVGLEHGELLNMIHDYEALLISHKRAIEAGTQKAKPSPQASDRLELPEHKGIPPGESSDEDDGNKATLEPADDPVVQKALALAEHATASLGVPEDLERELDVEDTRLANEENASNHAETTVEATPVSNRVIYID